MLSIWLLAMWFDRMVRSMNTNFFFQSGTNKTYFFLDEYAILPHSVKENEPPVSQALASEVINALLVESRKQEMVYKRHAITALGQAIAATHCDRFQQLYEIVKVILSKVNYFINTLLLGRPVCM